MSRVDVFVPCYHYGRFLRQCITSVLEQSLSEVRVLIVDDASPDDTPAVAAALAAEDPRVEVRRHDVNRGPVATFNEGIEWASGDYMLLLSADDFLLPGALERAVAFLDGHPEVGFVYGRWVDYRSGEAVTVPPPSTAEPASRIFDGMEFIRCLIPENHVSAPTVVVRTGLQKQLGGYREHLPHASDLDMWLRFALHGKVGAMASYQAAYRWHSQNMSSNYYRAVLPDIEQRRMAYAGIFTEFADRIPDHGRLEALTKRGLAEETLRSAHAAFNRNDLDTCRRCIEYAAKLWPEIQSSPLWRRLSWKHRLGPTASSLALPLLHWLRGRSAPVDNGADEVLTPRALARSAIRSSPLPGTQVQVGPGDDRNVEATEPSGRLAIRVGGRLRRSSDA